MVSTSKSIQTQDFGGSAICSQLYSFEEIEAPASTSTVTLADLRKALTDEGVSLPGISAKRDLGGLNVSSLIHRRSLHPLRNRVHLG